MNLASEHKNDGEVICYKYELRKQLADVLTECSSRHREPGAFSRNVSKLLSDLKLVTDNLLPFMQKPTEKPLKVHKNDF